MEQHEAYFPFYAGLTASQKALLKSALIKRAFKKGAVIHSGSDDCIGLLAVTGGRLRVYITSDEGKELTLYRLLDRDICLFSASCMMADIQFDVMVAAETDTRVLIVPPNVHKTLMKESAAAANYTNELMASRFSEVMWLIDQILNRKLDARLAALLLGESTLTDSDILFITHDQIAGHLGSVREVISRMLKYFQNEKYIEASRGRVKIIDKKGLFKVASMNKK